MKEHWENVYCTKQSHEVSWTQDVPSTSLSFIRSFGMPKSAKVIDIGGGDSKLADYLLQEGYIDITVLDISSQALERAKKRLGKDADRIKWIVSDISDFSTTDKYDIWHDRATFHFLTTGEQISRYMETAKSTVNGFITIGTFSDSGPEKCSGLHIKQYTEQELQEQLSSGFEKLNCITEDHTTPFQTKQNFLFCSFRRTFA